MKQAIFAILASLLTASCLNIYDAAFTPRPNIALVSVRVVGSHPRVPWSTNPGPYIRVDLVSDMDLQKVVTDRHLNIGIHAYRCTSQTELPPSHENDDRTLAYDPYLYDLSDTELNFDSHSTSGRHFHVYIDPTWRWNSLPHYDLSESVQNVCLRFGGGTGLEMGMLISYRIASNTILIPAVRLHEALAEYRAAH